jgi:hypothetical protein
LPTDELKQEIAERSDEHEIEGDVPHVAFSDAIGNQGDDAGVGAHAKLDRVSAPIRSSHRSAWARTREGSRASNVATPVAFGAVAAVSADPPSRPSGISTPAPTGSSTAGFPSDRATSSVVSASALHRSFTVPPLTTMA